MRLRLLMSLSAVSLSATESAAQSFNSLATTTTFYGCDTFLCSTMLLVTEPKALLSPPVPAAAPPLAIGFSVTHVFLPRTDGQGAAFGLFSTYGIAGSGGNLYWEDWQYPGGNCTSFVLGATAACTDPGTTPFGPGFTMPFTPTTATVRYFVGPVGRDFLRGSPIGVSQATLTLVAVPEPATFALVASGLLTLGGVVLRRWRAHQA